MQDPRLGSARVGVAAGVLAAALAPFVLPSRARADTACSILCTGSRPSPCVVSTTKFVPRGATIDCSGRPVTVTGYGKIRVDDGTFTLRAASLVVSNGTAGMIEANRVNDGRERGFRLEITGSVTIDGSLKAEASDGGGSISVVAGGNIDIRDYGNTGIDVSGSGAEADGGRIDLSSRGSIAVYNPLRARGGPSGACNGGEITLDAANDITIGPANGKLTVDGNQSAAGEIRLTAGNNLTIKQGSSLTANGLFAAGNGGGIYLTAGNKAVVSTPISARGGVWASGNDAAGGSLVIESGCGGAQINANLDLRGGELGAGYDAGSLDVSTLGDLSVASRVLIDAHAAGNGGSGGDVRLESGGKIILDSAAVIDARGDKSKKGGRGLAGTVSLTSCEIDVRSGVQVKASGLQGGAILLESGLPMMKVTTLHVAGNSVLDASGSSAASKGRIHVAVAHENTIGSCSTNAQRPCATDAECTAGTAVGQCLGLNPDTDDRLTQFLIAPKVEEDLNLATCENSCAP